MAVQEHGHAIVEVDLRCLDVSGAEAKAASAP